MTGLMLAEEAREKVLKLQTAAGREAKEKLVIAINNAVDKGQTCVWLGGDYVKLGIMRTIAEQHGYKVTVTQCQRDGNSIKVEWT